ncbi:MAG: GNAT family N-acetyltransferase [Alphaproteobacteria bacterium]|nr:MAG: GNAT family N-acetyltransferase [Alphaproteobacteria bacterium]
MTYSLRPARLADSRAILQCLHESVHGADGAAAAYATEILDAWAPSVTDETVANFEGAARSSLGSEWHEIWVAEASGRVIGFSELWHNELLALYVAQGFGKQGIGTALLSAAEHRARERGFHDIDTQSSLNARPFYAGHGFHVIQEQAELVWSEGVRMTCVVMRKHLGGAGG